MIADHHQNSGKATMWSVFGADIGALPTTLVTLDAYFTMTIFDGPPKFIAFLRLATHLWRYYS
jgi:hypothetical protein